MFLINGAHAQSSAAEAKAAYLLAEEEFNAGKYAASISYLDQATAKLGAANAKILYLKIMALQVLAEDDDASLEALKKAIAAFGKAPDYESFNEEKQLEVLKLKLRLEKEAVSGKPIEPLAASAYTKFGLSTWQVGAKLENMKSANPDFFDKAIKTVYSDTIAHYQTQDLNVTIVKGIIIGINKIVLASVKDDVSFTRGKNSLAEIKNYLGGNAADLPQTNYDSGPSKLYTRSYSTIGYSWTGKRILVTAVLLVSREKKMRQPESFESYLSVTVNLYK